MASTAQPAARLAHKCVAHARAVSEIGDAHSSALDQLRGELDAERGTTQQQRSALAAQLDAHGTAELQKQMELQAKLEAEREKRVAHVQSIAVRRIGQMGLARGWSAWHGQWAEDARRRRKLVGAAARLAKPALAACMSHWRHDWEEASRAQVSCPLGRAWTSPMDTIHHPRGTRINVWV